MQSAVATEATVFIMDFRYPTTPMLLWQRAASTGVSALEACRPWDDSASYIGLLANDGLTTLYPWVGGDAGTGQTLLPFELHDIPTVCRALHLDQSANALAESSTVGLVLHAESAGIQCLRFLSSGLACCNISCVWFLLKSPFPPLLSGDMFSDRVGLAPDTTESQTGRAADDDDDDGMDTQNADDDSDNEYQRRRGTRVVPNPAAGEDVVGYSFTGDDCAVWQDWVNASQFDAEPDLPLEPSERHSTATLVQELQGI